MRQKTPYNPTTPSRITRVSPNRRGVADALISTSTVVTDVIARDQGLSTERYLIFTTHDPEDVPSRLRETVEEQGFELRHMGNHAIEYRHADDGSFATYLAKPA